MTDMDLFYQNDKGKSINISKSIRDMGEKIDLCITRVLTDLQKADLWVSIQIRLIDDEWVIK